MTVADPAPEHDVTDGGEGGDLRNRSYRVGLQRIALRIPERMTAADRQHPDSGVDRVGRDDAEHVRARPNRPQHIAGPVVLGAEYSHSSA